MKLYENESGENYLLEMMIVVIRDAKSYLKVIRRKSSP